MYHHFTGTLTELGVNYAVIDCTGVGYLLTISGNTHKEIASHIGEAVTLLAYFAVKEDGQELFGFFTKEELDAFKLLITVSGVGAKAGISILTALTPDALASAIISSDAKAISQAQQIGGKIAARIILELHDKFGTVSRSSLPSGHTNVKFSGALNDALDGLIALGYTRNDAMSAIRMVKTDGRDAGDIIRDALTHLMKK